MLYPVYVHVGDDTHAHGVTVPDFPGCYSAADNWDELPAKIQEAIEVYCEGEDMDIPRPPRWKPLPPSRNTRMACGCWWTSTCPSSRPAPCV